jgi:hypothetical protein
VFAALIILLLELRVDNVTSCAHEEMLCPPYVDHLSLVFVNSLHHMNVRSAWKYEGFPLHIELLTPLRKSGNGLFKYSTFIRLNRLRNFSETYRLPLEVSGRVSKSSPDYELGVDGFFRGRYVL